MYRQGLGDCFLLTFDVGGDEAHMLIDCGTLGALTTGVTMASDRGWAAPAMPDTPPALPEKK